MHSPIAKVLVYVVSNGHLLVHRHSDFPEAGVQVPGGSINDGESAFEAALRELYEEAGLMVDSACTIAHRELFHAPWNGAVYDRHFIVIHCDLPLHDFHHVVTSGDADKGLAFVYFWLDLKGAIQSLDFGHAAGLQKIVDELTEL